MNMSIMHVDGFPKPVQLSPLEEIMGRRDENLKKITTFHFRISQPGWDILLRCTDHPQIFHFTASHREKGNIDVVFDVKDQENIKTVVLQRQGLAEELDMLLTEAIRVASLNYRAGIVTPYVKKLVITRYQFDNGVCVQRFVDVTKSHRGNYVVPGKFHGVKPTSLGQFYYHGDTAEMISLPENLERDRHHFNKCMFRLMRRHARAVAESSEWIKP